MADSSQRRANPGPLADLDEWESAYSAREAAAEAGRRKDPAGNTRWTNASSRKYGWMAPAGDAKWTRLLGRIYPGGC